LNRNVDNDISKAFKEFRSSDVARAYRSPFGQYGSLSILNSTIEDLIQIHEYIDGKRKEWLENFRTISEQAKEKQVFYLKFIFNRKIYFFIIVNYSTNNVRIS
jgi:hypothetical protein